MCALEFTYIRERFFFLWRFGKNTKPQVIFQRVYESMAEYFRIQHYGYNSHMLAIEFLEREPFEGLKIFQQYVPGSRLPELLDKLRECISNGISNYQKEDKETLVQIIKQFIILLDELQLLMESDPDSFKATLRVFADWLQSQESDIDRLLKMSN